MCKVEALKKNVGVESVDTTFEAEGLDVLYWEKLAAAAKLLQSCPTLCDPMDCSTPGFSVHHQLPELTQTHVH